jgi:hypothetical protein
MEQTRAESRQDKNKMRWREFDASHSTKTARSERVQSQSGTTRQLGETEGFPKVQKARENLAVIERLTANGEKDEAKTFFLFRNSKRYS